MRFSVLMSVYHKDSPAHLETALESVAEQTAQPHEIVLVEDGPIGKSIQVVLDRYAESLAIVRLPLPENCGLGYALSVGLSRCACDIIIRMDADDICLPHRFETQLRFLQEHPEIAVVGSAIAEFSCDPSVIDSVRVLPANGDKLNNFARQRNPLNHMTVMFRRSAILDVGNYQTAHGFEDYHLWARLLVKGYQLANLDEPLLLARCGNGMQARRGGWRYVIQETRFQQFLVSIGFISRPRFFCNLLVRTPMRMVPAQARSVIYKVLLRQKSTH